MLSHERIWAAIDALAETKQLSPSRLAREAGLDPTSFNKSKRFTGAGRPRWPSTESVAKALRATGITLADFIALVEDRPLNAVEIQTRFKPGVRNVPLLGLAQAGVGGFFDDGGFPEGHGWDQISFPATDDDMIYALEVSGNSMEPLYREGDIIIVQPGTNIRRNDRIVVRTNEGEVMAKELVRKTASIIELKSLNPEHDDLKIPLDEIDWVARIVWASQ